MNRQKMLKTIAFSLMGMIVLLLIMATVAEQLRGTDFALHYFYKAPWTIILWLLAVIFGVWYLCIAFRRLTVKTFSVYLLHFSFVVILLGALLTHLFGTNTELYLRIGDISEQFNFPVALDNFRIQYYPGTDTPANYVASLSLGQVSINHPLSYKGYRFFLDSYDEDASGCTFIVCHDPIGTIVTYIGYAILFLSVFIYLFLSKNVGRFSNRTKKIKHTSYLRLVFGSVLFLSAFSLRAEPSTLPRQQASELGNLCVFYNGRIEPLACLATDFTEKLCGKNSYRNYSAEQVYAGWLFASYTWLDEPIIHLKSADAKALHLPRNTSFNQLFSLKSAGIDFPPHVAEKYALIGMLLSGELTHIYPFLDKETGTTEWYSYSSRLPSNLPHEDWIFIKKSVDYMGELFFQQDYASLSYVIKKIVLYQQKNTGANQLPSSCRLRAERLWAAFPYTKPLALLVFLLGFVFFMVACLAYGRGKTLYKWWRILNASLLLLLWLFLSAMLVWRWYISGHIPLTNGYETMQSLAWFILLLGSVANIYALSKPSSGTSDSPILYGAMLISSFPLLVSMMSVSNPQITGLVPVLQSPLLSMHVSIIMLSYALLAFVMLNSLVALFSAKERQIPLMNVSYSLLKPAVCCLMVGIFLGAIWANISWGRYWGWDPKEVWALITLLIYAAPLHRNSLTFFRQPLVFHIYCLVAFLSVLFTYFGVNFILGGLHSYA